MTYRIPRPPFFDLNSTLNCGQCFRFSPYPESDGRCVWHGVAKGKYIRVEQTDKELIFYPCTEQEFSELWRDFFGLGDDYEKIRADIRERFSGHPVMELALERGRGIRIMRQDPHEALISFIISQNNNIPRIKGIVSSLCEKYGTPIEFEGNTYFSFPTAKALFEAGVDALYEIKTGFRAKYIYDAVKKELSGEIDLEKIAKKSSEEAICELKNIHGVGDKVANCVLLFGLSHFDAFPVDVWIKKVLCKYFPEGLDISSLGPYAGIAQQYLFHFEKYILDQE